MGEQGDQRLADRYSQAKPANNHRTRQHPSFRSTGPPFLQGRKPGDANDHWN